MNFEEARHNERRRILGLLRKFDGWLSQEIHNSTARRLAAANAGEPCDRYLFRALAMTEMRTELASVIVDVEEPEIYQLPPVPSPSA